MSLTASYTTPRVEGLDDIAAAHGLALEALLRLNRPLLASGLNLDALPVGTTVTVPVPKSVLKLIGDPDDEDAPEPTVTNVPAPPPPEFIFTPPPGTPPPATDDQGAIRGPGGDLPGVDTEVCFDEPPEGCPEDWLTDHRVVTTENPLLPQMSVTVCCPPPPDTGGGGIFGDIGDIAGDVLDRVRGTVDAALGPIDEIAGEALGFVAQQIGNAVPSLAELALSLGQDVSNVLEFVAGQMADLDEVGDVLGGALGAGFELAAPVLGAAFEQAMKFGLPGAFEFLEGEGRPAVKELTDEAAASAVNDPMLARMFGRPGNPEAPFDFFGMLAAFTAGLFAVAQARASSVIETARQRGMEADPSLQPPADQAAAAVLRGYIDDALYDTALRRTGYRPDWGQALRQLATTKVNVGEALELFRRGEWDAARLAAELREQGFTEERGSALASVAEVLPPIADELRFLVREVFQPETRAAFGMDEDFPTESLPRLRRLGLTEDNIRNYWAAHWELPSIQMGFEMLHRSAETGVTEAELDTLLRALDVMPFWRDRIKAISFNPFTRVDIRRMHQVGVLSDDQVVGEYQRIGYRLEDAQALAEFTFRLNARADFDLLETFRGPLRTRIVSNYINRNLSAGTAREALANLDYSDAEVDAFIGEARFARDADLANDARTLIGRLYERGFRDRPTTARSLRGIGLDEDDIADFFELYDLRREFRTERELESEQRDLTRADILGAYNDAVIPRELAVELLRDLGYDSVETETLVKREDVQRDRRESERRERFVRARYVKGSITYADARGELDALEVPVERRELLLDEWQLEREERRPTLTRAQVQAALKGGFIAQEDARRRLEDMGYVQEDVTLLIRMATEQDE